LTNPVDWINIRQNMLETAHRLKLYNVNYWDKEACAVNKNVSNLTELTSHQVKLLPLSSEVTVLDVGAGTGRMTLQVAKHAKHVTALEPSPNMLTVLQENMAKQQIPNITCINQTLEEMESTESYDLVVASFSLFMLNLKTALLKLDKLSTKAVYLFMSASPWVEEGLQSAIYGDVNLCSDFILTYNILHDLGVVANVDIHPYMSTQTYSNLEEATSLFSDRYCLPSEKRVEVAQYINARLVKEKNQLVYKRKMKAATIWWKKNK
jgi:SAM-dependent methyltransferase